MLYIYELALNIKTVSDLWLCFDYKDKDIKTLQMYIKKKKMKNVQQYCDWLLLEINFQIQSTNIIRLKL